jgi:predicted transcriptional regulator
MDLETLLASSCRRKILRVLSSNGRTNIMELVRKVNSTYNQVNSNLKILQKEGIVFDEFFGRMRVISLNKENAKTALLLQALKTLDAIEGQMSKQTGPAPR